MRRASIWWRGLGQPLAVFALLCQMVSAALAGPTMVAAQFATNAGIICHSVGPGQTKQDHIPGQHLPDCLTCPICLAASMTGLAPPPPLLPEPGLRPVAAMRPPARAGLNIAANRIAAQPRGPPAPV